MELTGNGMSKGVFGAKREGNGGMNLGEKRN
jgi:hypothetical protein